jgi:hypothetical protein
LAPEPWVWFNRRMMVSLRFVVMGALALVVGVGCEGKTDPGGNATEGDTETGIPPLDSAAATETGPGGSADTTAGGGSNDGATSIDPSASSGSATDPSATGDATTATGTGGGGAGVDCSGNVYQCGDGIDNDGDGSKDFPADTECDSASDSLETPVECSDGIDNDGDGRIDFGSDPGCASADDMRVLERPM